MIINHLQRILFATLLFCLSNWFVCAQTITFNNVPPLAGGWSTNGSGAGIFFNLTTNKAINLQNFRMAFSSNPNNVVTIYYNRTKINGQPPIPLRPNGWIKLGEVYQSGLSSTTSLILSTININLNLLINPGDTFGFHIECTESTIYNTNNTSIPIFTDGNITMIADASCAFSINGGFQFFTPRQINGGVIYQLLPRGRNDASVSQLISSPKFCGTSQSLRVRLSNIGTNSISNVNVNWSIDGILQPPIIVNALLDTIYTPNRKSDTILSMGTISYTPNTPRLVRVWTSMPNGVTDTITYNDTLRVILQQGLSGTYTLGNSTTNFASFTAAINKIDSFGRCGPITFNVTPNITIKQRPLSIFDMDSITFKKFGIGANPIVYGVGGTGSSDAIFSIEGSRNIVFDGIDVIDSSSNSNYLFKMEFGYNIRSIDPFTGSSNNIIRNCKIILDRTIQSIGILQSASGVQNMPRVDPLSLAGCNHNNRYENIKVENSSSGILLNGNAIFPDSNNIITSTGIDSTIIGANIPNDIGNLTNPNTFQTRNIYGIFATNQNNLEVSKCIIRNITNILAQDVSGIYTNVSKVRIWGNTVYNITGMNNSIGGTVHGLRIDGGPFAGNNAIVWNNLIYNINLVTNVNITANQIVRGISHGTSGGATNGEYYNNTVFITASNTGINSSTAAFWKGGVGNVIVRNNIFANVSPAKTGLPKNYGVFLSNNIGSFTSSNNIYWIPNSNSFVGFVTSDRTTLPLFAAASSFASPTDGNEQGSANANPNFVSPTNMNFAAATPAANSGTPITSPINISTDILGNPRNSTAPTIGAIETTQSLVDSAAPIISNVIITNSSSPIVRAVIRDNSNALVAGNIRLWYRSGNTGAFTSVAPDSVPTGTMNGGYRWSTAFNTLPVSAYQFYIAARDTRGPGLNLSVNPIQSASFTSYSSVDPVNYASNPDVGVNVRVFTKTFSLAPGVYPVGATSAPYFKLTDVANSLQFAELTGNVIFELQSNYNGTIGETLPIVFNPYFSVGGNWTITIRPALGVTGRETSGYPASTLPIIDLNGIDRLILDGRPGGIGTSNEWIIRSKRTSGSQNSPCIQFDNGAQRNLITNLKIESDNTTATSGAVFIFNTAINVGNSFNQILNCSISDRSDSTGSLSVGIYSAGTSGSTNDSNIISNNNVFNWTTSGVHVSPTGNGSSWRITNNHFYMTAARTTSQTAIRFEAGTAANGIRINGNFIGGTAPNAGGIPWINSVAGIWRGIVCAASLTDSVQIQNNTIQNLNLTGGTGTYTGIEMIGALASIRNNTIGHSTSPSSIQTSQLGTISSICLNNTSDQALIEGNLIANIRSTGVTTAVSHHGILINTGANTSPLIIRNNVIYNLSASNLTVVNSTASMVGILSSYGGILQTIERNIIYGLSNSGNAATKVFGINLMASGFVNINANTIYGLNNTSATAAAEVVGIHLPFSFRSELNVTNNMVSLGTGIDSLAIVTGIQDRTQSGENNTIAFNTVLITGNALSLASTSSHAYRKTSGSTTNIRNNIFQNIRTGGTGNYAIANTSTTPSIGWRANFNALHSANSAQLGLWNTTSTNFASWKTISLHDTASINTAASFVSLTDLHLTAPTVGNPIFGGRPFGGITTDFDGQTRQPNFPYMGADENTAFPLPVDLVSFTAKSSNNDAVLQWQTASEINNSHFIVERSLNANEFTAIAKVKGKGNMQVLSTYTYTDNNIGANSPIVYYRLRQVDFDETSELSKTVAVVFFPNSTLETIAALPNPFTDEINLQLESTIRSELITEIIDIQGRFITRSLHNVKEGNNIIPLEATRDLEMGIYFVKATLQGETKVLKVIKY